jgi:hypothetical protein
MGGLRITSVAARSWCLLVILTFDVGHGVARAPLRVKGGRLPARGVPSEPSSPMPESRRPGLPTQMTSRRDGGHCSSESTLQLRLAQRHTLCYTAATAAQKCANILRRLRRSHGGSNDARPLAREGDPLEQQLRSWKEIVKSPYSKLDVDAYTRTRIILMNGIEIEAWKFSHQFHR